MSDAPLPLPTNSQTPAGQSAAAAAAAQPGSGQAANQSGSGATPVESPPAATITYDDFAKVQLRVGTVLEAKPAPKGDRLLVLQVDLGGDERRQILAGIRQHVAPEQMVGRQIIVVANLAPRNMMGLTSQGMLLAATDPATNKVVVVAPSEAVAPGSKVS
jgi:methionine--tRNA ligase beta chain